MSEALIRMGVALALLVAGALAGYTWRDNAAEAELRTLEGKISALRMKHAEALAEAVEDARQSERATAAIQLAAADEEYERRVQAEIDLRRADDALVRVRNENGALRGRLAALNPELAESREAARAAVDLYADLLERCGARVRDVARFADQAYSAGQLCVESYEALNAPVKEPPPAVPGL